MSTHALSTVWCCLAASIAAAQSPGVVTERPAEGRYVEAGEVFLVPYVETIPGAGVTFTMQPIAGGVVASGEGETAQRLELAPYWIGQTEITWAQYRPYMELCDAFERFNDAGVRQLNDENRVDGITAPSKLYDPSFTFAAGEGGDLPAVTMSQYAAKQYTKWLSLLTGRFYRLPSDAEWERACRAGAPRAYSFGDDAGALGEYAWYEENGGLETHPVAQKKPNPWGLYDMHGNAREWVLDAHPDMGVGPATDPDGAGGEPPVAWPTKLYPRTLRGGSVFLDAQACESGARTASDDAAFRAYDPNTPKSPWWFASDDSQDVGFRVVRPFHAPPRERRERYWRADVPRVQRVADFRIDEEGRGERGLVDEDLPAAVEALSERR